MPAVRIFKTIKRGPREHLVVSEQEFRGKRRLDIRRCFKQKGGKRFNPSRRGVRFSPDELVAVAEVINEYIAEEENGQEPPKKKKS